MALGINAPSLCLGMSGHEEDPAELAQSADFPVKHEQRASEQPPQQLHQLLSE